jgi:tetratricopeptide (TPR) repeat protein
VALDPKDARLYFELDQLAEAADVATDVRLARLEKNHKVVAENDNALAREVSLCVRTGRAAKALEILRGHHFHAWEGGGEIHGLWVEANLAEGRRWFEKGSCQKALSAYRDALSYPQNLDAGPPSSGPGSPKIFYHLGLAHGALGNAAEATSCYHKAVAFGAGLSEQAYYRGLALAKLSRKAEASRQFDDLTTEARRALGAAPSMDFFEKFGERRSARIRQADLHFLAGLGLLGQEKEADAAAEFNRALILDPGHVEARRFAKR